MSLKVHSIFKNLTSESIENVQLLTERLKEANTRRQNNKQCYCTQGRGVGGGALEPCWDIGVLLGV